MNRFAIVAALVLATGTAFAAEAAKAPKLVSCEAFEVLKAESGTIGMCQPVKAGGKPRYLRSYVVTKITDPATEQPVSVMVGFQ